MGAQAGGAQWMEGDELQLRRAEGGASQAVQVVQPHDLVEARKARKNPARSRCQEDAHEHPDGSGQAFHVPVVDVVRDQGQSTHGRPSDAAPRGVGDHGPEHGQVVKARHDLHELLTHEWKGGG